MESVAINYLAEYEISAIKYLSKAPFWNRTKMIYMCYSSLFMLGSVQSRNCHFPLFQ